MRLSERLRPLILRWGRVFPALAVVLPFVVACGLGFVWLSENALLIPFVAASIVFGALVSLPRLAVRWWRSRKDDRADTEPPQRIHARIDPDWSTNERKAFDAARAFIDEATTKPVPWQDMQSLATEVVRRVAMASGRNGKDILDFSVPEALLLVNRVSSRLRVDLRDRMPFADSVSVKTLHWIWQHREQAMRLQRHGQQAWRLYRLVRSLPVAVLREIEAMIAGGHTSFVTNEGVAVVQTLILEEVAVAAVDLYSGRLRFSDAELLQMRRSAGEDDHARLATPDAPLRIAIAGQISSGKSSLINALLGSDVAETDVLPTTDRPQTYEAELDGVSVVLLDLPGLDGSARVATTVQDEIFSADMVVWAIRANRPAREIDRAAIAAFRDYFAERPERRRPPLVVALTFIDALLDEWPLPENLLTEAAMGKVHDVVSTVASELGKDDVFPLPVVLTMPDWNVDTLRMRIAGQTGEALMAQRNRLRQTPPRTILREELSRATKGFASGLSVLTDRRTPPRSDE